MNFCKVCNCSDKRACKGGCTWINDERDVCTQCGYRIAMKGILEDLSDAGIGVTIQMENCKVCVNNRNVRGNYIYHLSYLSDKYGSMKIPYIEIIQDKGFINAVVRFIWNYANKSKGKYPKVVWMEGMLHYEDPNDLIEDLENFIKAADEDEIVPEFIWDFWKKNIEGVKKKDLDIKASDRARYGVVVPGKDSILKTPV